MPKRRYNLANIRELVSQSFSDSELRVLCFDRPGFRRVYDALTPTTGKAEVVLQLLDQAARQGQIDLLLALAQQRHRAHYQAHRPYHIDDSAETFAHTPGQDTGRYYSCFISYTQQDEAFAQKLYADLQASGVACWFAPEDLKIGDKLRQTLDQAVKAQAKLLIILSAHSIASEWVEKEVETAFEEERTRKQVILFPIRLDEAVMATDQAWASDIRRMRHIGDFSRWQDSIAYEWAFGRLLRDLKGAGG